MLVGINVPRFPIVLNVEPFVFVFPPEKEMVGDFHELQGIAKPSAESDRENRKRGACSHPLFAQNAADEMVVHVLWVVIALAPVHATRVVANPKLHMQKADHQDDPKQILGAIEERRVAFAPDNPFRTPSWRWECARFRAENGWTVPPRTEGRWIRRAFRFHQVLLKYHREEAFDRLLKWRPELVFAYELWANTQSMARDIVEACILSGQTTDQIARKLCFHWEGIDAYAELFYDVRHKLRHRGYVNAVLIGPELSGPLARVTFPTVLKSFAYHMGPHALDALLGVYNSNVAPLAAEGIPAVLPQMAHLELTVKAAVAAKLIPVNEQTAPLLWQLFVRIVNLEARVKNQPDAQEDLRRGIEHMFAQLSQSFADCFESGPTWLKQFVRPAARPNI
jgi:hypothetical protein